VETQLCQKWEFQKSDFTENTASLAMLSHVNHF